MTSIAVSNKRSASVAPLVAPPKTTERPSRLLTSIYHDIGMAAVAISLDLAPETLDRAAHESVKRGSRYIYLMPKREDSPPSQR